MDLADFEKEHAEEIETEFMRRLSETEGMVQALITLNPELYREVLMDLASEYGVRD